MCECQYQRHVIGRTKIMLNKMHSSRMDYHKMCSVCGFLHVMEVDVPHAISVPASTLRGSIKRHNATDHNRHPTPTLGGTPWLSRYLGQKERDISTFSMSGDCARSPPAKLDFTLLWEPSICHLFSFAPKSSRGTRLPISPSAHGQTVRGHYPLNGSRLREQTDV